MGPPTVRPPSGKMSTDQPLSTILPIFSRLGLTAPSLASGKPLPKRGFATHRMGFRQRWAAPAMARRRRHSWGTALMINGLSKPRL